MRVPLMFFKPQSERCVKSTQSLAPVDKHETKRMLIASRVIGVVLSTVIGVIAQKVVDVEGIIPSCRATEQTTNRTNSD